MRSKLDWRRLRPDAVLCANGTKIFQLSQTVEEPTEIHKLSQLVEKLGFAILTLQIKKTNRRRGQLKLGRGRRI